MPALLLPGGVQARHRNDPFRPLQWNLDQIHAREAWAITTGRGARVAVVDSGVDYRHEELRGKVIAALGASSNCRPMAQRCRSDTFDGSHGTFVASVIGARLNNSRGIAGVAPRAKLISVVYKVGLARAIRFAMEHAADVINMSLSVGLHEIEGERVPLTGNKNIIRAVEAAWRDGAVIVAAAANDLLPLCESMQERILCVGALDRSGGKAWYSNYGVGVDLWAPGGGFFDGPEACDPNDPLARLEDYIIGASIKGTNEYCGASGYMSWYGTSFATPHISGVAALLASQGLNNRQIVRCLKQTADDLGAPGVDPIYGHGRVNAYRAVTEC